MRPAIADEFDPPFVVIEPVGQTLPSSSTSPMRAPSIRPPSWPQSRLDALALRRSEDAFVDELFAARGRARRAADDGPVSRAPISTSTASPMSSIRACSTAGCRPSPIPARCASPAGSARSRGSSPTGRRSIAGRLPVDEALRRIEWLYKPYHRMLRQLVHRTAADLRPRRADRLPFDALDAASAATTAPRPISCSATATAPAARRCSPTCRSRPARPRLYGGPQQALCRRLHHRALRRAGPRPPCAADRDQPRALHGRAQRWRKSPPSPLLADDLEEVFAAGHRDDARRGPDAADAIAAE